MNVLQTYGLLLSTFLFVAFSSIDSQAQESKPIRYSLMVAVTKYNHAELNKLQFELSGIDAKAIGKFPQDDGHQVDDFLCRCDATCNREKFVRKRS